MKICEFDNIYQNDITLINILPTMRFHKEHSFYNESLQPRHNNALIYFQACCGEYTLADGSQVNAEPNDIIYIPKGTTYKVTFSNTQLGVAGCIRIEFDILSPSGEDVIFSSDIVKLPHAAAFIKDNFLEMVEIFNRPAINYCHLKSIFYDNIAHLSLISHSRMLSQKQFGSIRKGIEYIETDPDQSLTVDEIAEICHVSPGFFRSLFKKYSGQSPTEYRISRKIERAKRLLQSEEKQISEIADDLGFQNVYYFSRLFKSRVGMSPKEYQDIVQ